MIDITAEVETWPGVSTAPHRFAGREFSVGGREIGHLHGQWQVDVPLTRRLRDALVDEGVASPHHIYPESGWVTYYLDSEAGARGAVRLLRLSYLRHVRALGRRDDAPPEIGTVDVDAELDRLDPSDAVREAFGVGTVA
ncbi:luciferase domain-containing protein [Halomarina pelagica]|uniref:luciferase domain-containing protein n=1 Tax=Halomarina pelagica TaxID=2961599 RepID=UPI0020C1CB58|nr:luciferase family protein [Halomarina sp. BND7]